MIFGDYYEINLRVGDKFLEMLPTNFSFSMQDSIHQLFNWGKVTFHDASGVFQESLATIEGLDVELNLSTVNNKKNNCIYSIMSDSLDRTQTKGLINGDVTINIVNKWFNEQTILSKGYDNKISSIVKLLADKYFSNTDIKPTGAKDIWYQNLITDAKFIKDILLPNAYSPGASNSPFYCYITSNNIFNFKDLKSILSSNPRAILKYDATDDKYSSVDNIQNLKRWRDGSNIHKNLRHRQIFKINSDTGLLEIKDSYMSQYPSISKNSIPIVGNKNLINSYQMLGFSKTDTGKKENQLGLVNSEMKNSMFIEEFMVIIPLNSNIHSGDQVDLNIFSVTKSSKNDKLSKAFSGRYVVEESEHIWNGKEKKGISRLVLGRKFINLPNTYHIKSKFIS